MTSLLANLLFPEGPLNSSLQISAQLCLGLDMCPALLLPPFASPPRLYFQLTGCLPNYKAQRHILYYKGAVGTTTIALSSGILSKQVG